MKKQDLFIYINAIGTLTIILFAIVPFSFAGLAAALAFVINLFLLSDIFRRGGE